MGPPTTGVRGVQCGNGLEPSPTCAQADTHPRHTRTCTDVHTHVHMHRRHTDTLTQYSMHTLRHAYLTDVHAGHTYTHTWADKTHTCASIYTERHACTDTCAQANPDAHMSHTDAHTPAQTPARGHDDAICTWVESSGLRKAAEWGLGKRDLCVSVGGVTQHLRAGTREERQRWGKRWVWEEGRQLRLCGQQRSFQRVSEASWVHTGVLTRQQEDRLRLRGVRGLP